MIVRERVRAAGIAPEGYSGHSLRAGLATSAAQAGVSSWKMRQQTGHASDAMLARYIRDGDLSEIGDRQASLLDKILHGANPGELPFERPTLFKLAVNLKTAGLLGLTLPPTLLARADEIVE